MTLEHFWLLSKELLTTLHKFYVDLKTKSLLRTILMQTTQFYSEWFEIYHVQNFFRFFLDHRVFIPRDVAGT